MSKSEVPTLFIHGTEDKVVPYWMAEKLYANKPGDLNVFYPVQGAAHMESCVNDKEQYKKVVTDFIQQVEILSPPPQ